MDQLSFLSVVSFGNGGLMRLSPAILAACELDEAVQFAAQSTRLMHGAALLFHLPLHAAPGSPSL